MAEELSPEQDVEIARRALQEGELRHAAHHIGCALRADPTREEWVELLDEILAAAPDPLALSQAEEKQGLFVGTAAVRARTLVKLDRPVEALELLLDMIASQPSMAFETWALDLLKDDAVAWGVDPARVRGFVSRIMGEYPGLVVEGAARRRLLELLPVAERLHAGWESDGDIGACYAGILRKAGRLDEALPVAERAHASDPKWMTCVAVALAKRALGDLDGAREAFQRALEHDPEDLTARLDIADLFCEEGRTKDGVAWYEQVLARSPEHDWALPSMLFGRSLLEPVGPWWSRLQTYASAHPENERAAQLVAHGLREPYRDFLPPPTEATVNLASRMLDSKRVPDPGSTFSVGLSALESPSSRLALEWAFPGVRLAFEVTLQEPDPRRPRGKVDFVLWRYEGTDPRPALPRPDEEVARAVGRIAALPFSWKEWRKECRALGTLVGAARALELARVMCHPPRPGSEEIVSGSVRPAGRVRSLVGRLVGRPPVAAPPPIWHGAMAPAVWIQRVQLASALALLYVDSGWSGSARRRILLDLARGPLDWSVEAAVVALTEAALECGEALPEVASLFTEMADSIPRPGACCYEGALLRGLLRLPSMSPADRGRFRTALRQLDE